jgi:hypothetical protein
MELHDLLESVSDEQSFLTFVNALRKDREADVTAEKASPSSPYGPTQGGWENVTIESFLASACSWAEDTGFGETQGLGGASPWKKSATFLYLGKIYE